MDVCDSEKGRGVTYGGGKLKRDLRATSEISMYIRMTSSKEME